ncbi:Differentially expressed in FDCP 8-like protein [Trichoplax sp. H2]|nr:Differentially expressed in FDCP 8-like protein [Trichoplax sp. H2]|eukprot:RDD46970.1 Differentially expressed in FDCP 8-like protein [Trichoplax sp. H2]
MNRLSSLLKSSQAAIPTDQERYEDYKQLFQTLNDAIAKYEQSYYDNYRSMSSNNEMKNQPEAEELCNCFYNILCHGLKASLWSQSTFWPVIEKISHRNVLKDINSISNVSTNEQRCKAWIRLALNESALDSYLTVFTQNKDILDYYYEPYAFVMDDGKVMAIQKVFSKLGSMKVEFNVQYVDSEKGKSLNKATSKSASQSLLGSQASESDESSEIKLTHRQLLSGLQSCVKEIKKNYSLIDGYETKAFIEDSTETAEFCRLLELILSDGLKASRLTWRDNTFWRIATKISHREIIETISRNTTSSSERTYSWLRLALNEATLLNYIEILTSSNDIITTSYEPTAFLLNISNVDELNASIDIICKLPFALVISNPVSMTPEQTSNQNSLINSVTTSISHLSIEGSTRGIRYNTDSDPHTVDSASSMILTANSKANRGDPSMDTIGSKIRYGYGGTSIRESSYGSDKPLKTSISNFGSNTERRHSTSTSSKQDLDTFFRSSRSSSALQFAKSSINAKKNATYYARDSSKNEQESNSSADQSKQTVINEIPELQITTSTMNKLIRTSNAETLSSMETNNQFVGSNNTYESSLQSLTIGKNGFLPKEEKTHVDNSPLDNSEYSLQEGTGSFVFRSEYLSYEEPKQTSINPASFESINSDTFVEASKPFNIDTSSFSSTKVTNGNALNQERIDKQSKKFSSDTHLAKHLSSYSMEDIGKDSSISADNILQEKSEYLAKTTSIVDSSSRESDKWVTDVKGSDMFFIQSDEDSKDFECNINSQGSNLTANSSVLMKENNDTTQEKLNYRENSDSMKLNSGVESKSDSEAQAYSSSDITQNNDRIENYLLWNLSYHRKSCKNSTVFNESEFESLIEYILKEEDYQPPPAYFTDCDIADLVMAIRTCKKLLALSYGSNNDLKETLVSLRIRLQEIKESSTDWTPNFTTSSSGHQLVKIMTHDSLLRLYCNVCHRRIWCTIQTFYKCSVCDLFTHLKCKESISKMCQTYKTPQTVFIMTIRPEIGLSSQQHRCADCRRFIGLANKKSKQVLPEARICDYQGRYHCSNCHKNEQTVIPARVIRNWDFSTRTVCQRCSNMLELLSNHPVIPLESINANLFSHIDDLVTVKNLRMTLSNLRLYVHS